MSRRTSQTYGESFSWVAQGQTLLYIDENNGEDGNQDDGEQAKAVSWEGRHSHSRVSLTTDIADASKSFRFGIKRLTGSLSSSGISPPA